MSFPNVFRFLGWPSSPGVGSAPVTPSDSADLPKAARRLYVTGAGAVHFTAIDGSEDTLTVPASCVLEIAVARVWATGTTATGIHAIF